MICITGEKLVIAACAGLRLSDDRRVVCDASFYVLPTPLTILIWSGPARTVSRHTGQVLVRLINASACAFAINRVDYSPAHHSQPIFQTADWVSQLEQSTLFITPVFPGCHLVTCPGHFWLPFHRTRRLWMYTSKHTLFTAAILYRFGTGPMMRQYSLLVIGGSNAKSPACGEALKIQGARAPTQLQHNNLPRASII